MDTVDVITMKMEGRDVAAYPQMYTGEHGIVDMSIGYTFSVNETHPIASIPKQVGNYGK